MADDPSDIEVLDPPTALVTGAGGHIGRALLRLLTPAGYRVIGVDRPGTPMPSILSAAAGDGWRTTDSRAAVGPRWIEVDLADPTAATVLDDALVNVPRLDLVIAGAGVTALGDFGTTADAAFEQVMAVNYHGALRTARAALPALRAARGHLVAISSVAGLLPVPGRPAYVGAKHAVTGTFLALADELAHDGVAVTVVHPAFLDSAVVEVGGGGARSSTRAALTADDVARDIVRLVARRRAGRRVPTRALIGRTAYLADAVARIAPGTARRLAARKLQD
jgi:NAD(P)-dependent dehydrogenase (short-subunit alcohol dehydrogenase family)